MDSIIVRTYKSSQGSIPFYLFLINSRDLLHISYVIIRSEDPKKGIQRITSSERLTDIASFVKESTEVIFPNNLIINFDKKAQVVFRPDIDKPTEGELVIPRKEKIAQVIDGQHRLYGLEKTDKNIPLIVVGFEGLSVTQQAKIFLTINSKQKGINTSLVYDLFGITRSGENVELIAIDISKSLNSDEDSPFKDMVKLTDARKKDKETLSLAAFVVSMKKILKNKDIAFSNLDSHQQIILLKNYFQCVRQMFMPQWGTRGYILTKTLGFSALMKVFPKVHLRCVLRQDLLGANIESQIEGWKDFDFSSKEWEGVSGEAGATKLASILESKLKQLGTK